ncbi:DEAD box helicase [Ectocarpus siliculosus]|uniref:RNA helicase n=1 Tax=Ectocarpus siliculosus TaxID=2880 RepID=D8LEE8_ECTSI|nr:DEAD box helicase [Ectocarpus siliculosus]|eukprot:CBN74235.1 DEAD box helicase [Ectocarpus siliculosus]
MAKEEESAVGASPTKEERKALKKARKKAAKAAAEAAAAIAATPATATSSKKSKKKRKADEAAGGGAAAAEGGNEGNKEESATKVKKLKKTATAADSSEPGSGKKKKKKKKNKSKDKSAPSSSAAEDSVASASAAAAAAGGAATGAGSKVHIEGMKVTPLKDFASSGMPAEVMKYVTLRGWDKPTLIQAHCWPVLNAGRDVIGIAETGSGKTLGFSLPAMSKIFKNMKAGKKSEGPYMLVLAPTRELALQSAEVIAEAGGHCGIKSVCVYGGVPKRDQKIALGGGRGGGCVQVVVATPGRLKDLVGEGACDLSKVTSLVLDEADRMLDLGFEQDVRDIIGYCAGPSKRQTAMFSATWPKSIRDLAAEFLADPVKVTVGADDLTANYRVEQHVEVVEERERDGKLLRLLATCHKSRKNRVLVFALYKREAARLEQFLQRNNFDAVAVHGDKGQADRERALGQFKSKERPLMVATDVAARGLDIPDVEYVINYSFPLTIEDYIHRIGRTGRAGKKGVSHTYFHQGDKARAGELVNVLQDANQSVPEALTKFGTHVKKKEHKLYGAFAKDVDMDRKATKTTFDDSDDE